MRGAIRISTGEISQSLELEKGALSIGSGAADGVSVAVAGVAPGHCRLDWDPGAASWVAGPGGPGLVFSLNGVVTDSPVVLSDEDILGIGTVAVRFARIPDLPVYRGRPCTAIPLDGNGVVLGRSDGNDAPEKVVLDPEDHALSRDHVALVPSGEGQGGWTIEDHSAAGSFLNGQPLKAEQLVVGDRFRIGGYTFEFTGLAIVLVRSVIGGRVEARELGVTIGTHEILTGVSLDIDRCEFVGILGGSGQGKSTLMNALCGIRPGSAGTVLIDGVEIGRDGKAPEGIGYVPQDDIVHRELTVRDAVMFSARLRLDSKTPRAAVRALVEKTVERLGLNDHVDKQIAYLSGGQRKRVSIATELLAKPGVLFLDEPSSGLDPATEYALMGFLRRLAATDCTVICTTHVLGRAYLFDNICFIQDRRLVFKGRPEEALEHFDADDLDSIYVTLDGVKKSGAEWEAEFREARASVDGASLPVCPLPEIARGEGGSPNAGKGRKGTSYLATLGVLLSRQWKILRSAPLNLVFLLAQPLLIGGLVGWVSEDPVFQLFLCVVATLWFGCSNGAQQIVREISVFRRERVSGLGINAYLQSKFAFLTAVTVFQAMLLLGCTLGVSLMVHPAGWDADEFKGVVAERLAVADGGDGEDEDPLAGFEAQTEDGGAGEIDLGSIEASLEVEPEPPGFGAGVVAVLARTFSIRDNVLDGSRVPEGEDEATLGVWKIVVTTVGLRVLALVLASGVGVGTGLAISALVQSETQAVMWVPLVLIPQLLFAGFVVTRPEMTVAVRGFSMAVPSYSAQRLMDVAGLYGQRMPAMSNQTKIPLFLTSGGIKETIEWSEDGKVLKQKYDEISEQNTSWQNLLVFPDRVGQRKHDYRRIAGKIVYDETTRRRNDVHYEKGTLYRYLGHAQEAAIALLIWIASLYTTAALGLRAKQRGA